MDDAGIVSYNVEGQLLSEELVINRRRACVLYGDYIISDNAAHRQRIHDAPVIATARRAELRRKLQQSGCVMLRQPWKGDLLHKQERKRSCRLTKAK